MPSLALAMIVKNEEKVIERCLNSVMGLVDHAIIVDTGSTDDTWEIAKAHELPTIQYRREWVDFGHNRNELLDLAEHEADYLLLLDADMTVRFTGPPKLEADAYMVRYTGDLDYEQKLIVRTGFDYHYIGKTHEYITSELERTCERCTAITVTHHGDGGSKEYKFIRDYAILKDEIRKNPDDPRTMFYLARTEESLGELELAARHFEIRSTMGAFEEEAWFAQYRAAAIRKDPMQLLKAWERRPWRAEPLCHVATFSRHETMWNISRVAAKTGLEIPYPQNDALFIDRGVYDWGLLLELSVAEYHLGRMEEFKIHTKELLQKNLPKHVREIATKNLEFTH